MAEPVFTIFDASAVRTSLADFPHAKALEDRLRSTVRGEVRFDAVTRALYATDASNYRQFPIGPDPDHFKPTRISWQLWGF